MEIQADRTAGRRREAERAGTVGFTRRERSGKVLPNAAIFHETVAGDNGPNGVFVPPRPGVTTRRGGGIGGAAKRYDGGTAAGRPNTSSARKAAARRVSTPSFSNTACTCFLTVPGLVPKISAISAVVLP